MVDQRDGNAIYAERVSKAAEAEAEAWKIAQLAAELMAGRFASNSSPSVPWATDLAKDILNSSRSLVKGSQPS